ncbi:WHG domain-containing protein [Gordonia sp. OPL2]|nr:WHG domain-containing protein [Gordonia sp. OPL2]
MIVPRRSCEISMGAPTADRSPPSPSANGCDPDRHSTGMPHRAENVRVGSCSATVVAYVMFAVTHPGHFEVMFRPDLYRDDDSGLREARDAAFDLLYKTARASMSASPDEDITGVVVAGWAMSHGLATLWRTGNLRGRLDGDPSAVAEHVAKGVVELGRMSARSLGQDR